MKQPDDPRAKLLSAFVWLIALFLVYHSIGQLIGLCLTLLVIRLNGVRIGTVVTSVRYLLLFLPLTFLVHLLIISGGWRLFTGEQTLSWSLFDQPLFFTVRMANLIIFMGFMLRWIRDIEFLDAVYHLLRPLRRLGLNADDFFQTIFIAVKFFPILREEYQHLDEAWKVFGGGHGDTLSRRIQRVRKSLIPLMIFSFQRAEVLADAISVRGYNADLPRSYYQSLRFQGRDWMYCGAALSILTLIIIWI